MADFERSMQLLAERGTPIGPDELIERVEAQLAGHAQVPARRRYRVATTPPPRIGLAWAAAAFVLVLAAVGAVLLLLDLGAEREFVDTTTVVTTVPPPTTVPVSPTDAPVSLSPAEEVALVETAYAAWYGGDFDTVSQLIDMPGRSAHSAWSPEDFQAHMEYDAAVSARVEGTCTEPSESGGPFECTWILKNALTDAMDLPDETLQRVLATSGDSDTTMRVVDGKLSRYEFHIYEFLSESFSVYLQLADATDGYEDCYQAPFDAACAAIRLEHLDDWVAWNESNDPVPLAQALVEATFAGDCDAATALIGNFQDPDCSGEMLYEIAVDGTLDVSGCVADSSVVSCDGAYSSALHAAVGAPALVAPIEVSVDKTELVWGSMLIESPHPVDEALLRSYRDWAVEAGLGDTIDDQCGFATPRTTPECAGFLLDNLDAWADWYLTNN